MRSITLLLGFVVIMVLLIMLGQILYFSIAEAISKENMDGAKSPYLRGLKEPFIVQWSGKIKSGYRSKNELNTQLFDLSTDIQEQHDVAAQHPGIVKRIEDIMKKEHHAPEFAKF